jgi:dihydrolipoamide dehydrogenase
MLAHKAMAEGRCAARNAMGREKRMDYKAIPRCIWTSPEVAAVGLPEWEAKERYGDVKVSSFPFTANGKAKILGETEGFVKIMESRYGKILGVHLLTSHATEMIMNPSWYNEATFIASRNDSSSSHIIRSF